MKEEVWVFQPYSVFGKVYRWFSSFVDISQVLLLVLNGLKYKFSSLIVQGKIIWSLVRPKRIIEVFIPHVAHPKTTYVPQLACECENDFRERINWNTVFSFLKRTIVKLVHPYHLS